jgi:hypothetical protein
MIPLYSAVMATPLFGLALPPLDLDAIEPVAIYDTGAANDAAQEWTAEELERIETRTDLALVHRIFGVSTWVAMATTGVLGFIQYMDEYGFFASENDTPCARNEAIIQSACTGVPLPHAIAAGTTAVLYGTTFTLALLMPDPVGLEEGSERANQLELHKLLRWITFGGVLAQAVLGATISLIGDDAFDARQALATVHLGIGAATFATLSVAGAIMVF